MNNKIVRITEQDIHNMVQNIINEAFGDLYQPNHIMDNNNNMYDCYVVINNSDQSLVANCQYEEDAIDEANECALNDRYGSYSVVGCVGNEYDLDDEKSIIYTADYSDLKVYENVDNTDTIITEVINKVIKEAEMQSVEDFEERTEKAHKREGEKINTADSGKVKKFLNNPYINVSKVIEDATGLEPTSASSEGSKFASGERPITQNLQNTVNRILQDLTN